MTSFGILDFHSNAVFAFMNLFTGICSAFFYSIVYHKAFAIPMITRKLKLKMAHLAKTKIADEVDRRAMCAQIRSIPPVGIKVGSFHTFERMSTPNFLGFGLKNIVRILIAFRNK